VSEPATSRERIRAELERGFGEWPAPHTLDEWAARIDEALFGPEPGEWVGPQLTADELGEITGPHRGCERVVLGPGQRPCSVLRLARHIDCQSATIRNQNAENADLRRRLAEAHTTIRAFVPEAP
jgi:hypothetical protein